MIERLRKVTKDLYRGSAPTPLDIASLKDSFGIKKIVSLDKMCGLRIDRTCKILNIEHIIIPIEIENIKSSLLNFLKYDLKKLFLEGGPVYVHCEAGKDRTGLATALVQCKYLGKSAEDAIEEAKSLGFGIGIDPRVISIFEKLIRCCKPSKDINAADIVSNEREYISDNRDSFLDEGHQGSFAPYLNVTRQNPMDAVYNFILDQSPTRENYNSYKSIKEHDSKESLPLVGIYNNDAGIHGAGPAEPVGGFISD
jgi:hypothetical protein